MGLFSKKHSKPSLKGDNDLSTSIGARNSNLSIKSPPLPANSSNGAAAFPATAKIPDIALPKPPDPSLDPAAYLRSIYSVRERSKLVLQKAKKNQLTHFDVDPAKFEDTAGYVCSIIKVRRLLGAKATKSSATANTLSGA